MLEKNFDIPFVSQLALREKQVQQNYRPIITIHKWFARRPGTLFRSLILSEFSSIPLRECYFSSNSFPQKRVLDPFMGGGTPLVEANRLSCKVTGFDINPMAFWIVKQEIDHLEIANYLEEGEALRARLESTYGNLMETKCLHCGSPEADVKYFLWVKTIPCSNCGETIDLFPGGLVAKDVRHPRNVFVCMACGELHETTERTNPGKCPTCQTPYSLRGPALRGQCTCPKCNATNKFPSKGAAHPSHRLFALEYHCVYCRPKHKGRFFKRADPDDIEKYQLAEKLLSKQKDIFIPDDAIPAGDETNRLLRWGYRKYREMFNSRQLLLLQASAEYISQIKDVRVRNALVTNLSDLLRYQNMLCRYDTMALKSLDIFSVHGFPVGLIQCESNFMGIIDTKRGINIGSGGWSNILTKYAAAKRYCSKPFEIRCNGRGKETVYTDKEWIGDRRNGNGVSKDVAVFCRDATTSKIRKESLDAVFTDPPYFGNVQYAELMDFCYVWLRKLLKQEVSEFEPVTTRQQNELTANETLGRDLAHYTEGLSEVFRKMAHGLKPGGPLVFTYHHNRIEAYLAVGVALLDSGLVCSASLPCPAEMGGSIHISNSTSSIIDTVLVARSTGRVPRKWIPQGKEEFLAMIAADVSELGNATVNATAGDIKCIVYGHLTRLAVWQLRSGWNGLEPTATKIRVFQEALGMYGPIENLVEIAAKGRRSRQPSNFTVAETTASYGARENDEIPF